MRKEDKAKEIVKLMNEYQKLYYPFDFTEEERKELLEKDYNNIINDNTDYIIEGLKAEVLADVNEDDFWGAQRVLEIIEKIFEIRY